MVAEKEIAELVSEMLYFHDCVVIPGFGGFVARNVPAQINPVTNAITPPSKSILFNKNLTNNDGLLATAFAERFNLPFSEAMNKIYDFASSASQKLTKEQRLEFGNVGVLFNDGEKNVQFEPAEGQNFSFDSFGLPEVFARPIEKNSSPKIQFNDRKDSVKKLSENKLSFRLVAAVVVPVCLLIGFFIATSLAPTNSELASLNPFKSSKVTHYQKNNFLPALMVENENELQLSSAAQGTFCLDEECSNPVTYSDAKTELVAPSLSNNNSSSSNKKNQGFIGTFEVVVGCFREKGNAEKLIAKLQLEQIESGISGTNKKGLFVVSAGGFESKNSAIQLAERIKANCPGAWIKY